MKVTVTSIGCVDFVTGVRLLATSNYLTFWDIDTAEIRVLQGSSDAGNGTQRYGHVSAPC